MRRSLIKMLQLVMLLMMLLGGSILAQDEAEFTPEPDVIVEIPTVIYGNEPQLKNNILFTMDDCYDEILTREMSEFLHERGLTGIFFPLTLAINDDDPQLWQDIVAAGFEIGYHTRFHQEGLTQDQLEADFLAFTEEIRVILDDSEYVVQYVRPPYGIWNNDWLIWAEENDLHTVRWNIVTRFDLTMGYFEGVLRHADGGGIVLMHPRPTDIWWLENNIDAVLELRDDTDNLYLMVNLTEAFND